ncbi:hypothetical protein [Lignipirellula cremea]|uniref:Uncharacterized protein n=1 Tax=Lignipirellula cremea TaxID=2528010 RepID=A0A518DSW7_9BACT|nr:hypothetical protein [Lignipirellula cremea]QDU94932.1 hypothetical protein Pla8534_27400 [Lignipirellula cremea]
MTRVLRNMLGCSLLALSPAFLLADEPLPTSAAPANRIEFTSPRTFAAPPLTPGEHLPTPQHDAIVNPTSRSQVDARSSADLGERFERFDTRVDAQVQPVQFHLVPGPPTPILNSRPLNPYLPEPPGISSLPSDEPSVLNGHGFKPIGQVSAVIASSPGDYPTDFAAAAFDAMPTYMHSLGMQRDWSEVAFTWEAPAVWHTPLYFEEAMLERHGQTAGPVLQPIISGAHFFSRFPIMPYLTALDRPTASIYTLGHYRPGSHAPLVRESIPLKVWPTLVQAGVVSGFYFLFP